MKSYNRYCDFCKKEIKNLYDYGVTTLYKNIRIGRGCKFKDYKDNSILNEVNEVTPEDLDLYGRHYKNDEDREFSFCSPECLFGFLRKLYKETYDSSLRELRASKRITEQYLNNFKKRKGMIIEFFSKIQTGFSKAYFRNAVLEECDNILKEIKQIKKKLLEEVSSEDEFK